jgi:hypothetical protein
MLRETTPDWPSTRPLRRRDRADFVIVGGVAADADRAEQLGVCPDLLGSRGQA